VVEDATSFVVDLAACLKDWKPIYIFCSVCANVIVTSICLGRFVDPDRILVQEEGLVYGIADLARKRKQGRRIGIDRM
jgi:hypothetical protein